MTATAASDPAATGRILAVDDEPMLLTLMRRVLESSGFEVETAANARAAAELVAARPYDLIVSDLTMPDMSGIDLLRAVRKKDADLPFILMTGNPTMDTAIEALEGGAVRYLKKPCGNDVLRQSVAVAVEAGRNARALRAGSRCAEQGRCEALAQRFERAQAALFMAYQPIVSWSERRVFAYEALVRTREPSIPDPGVLFDTAEQLGALARLGRCIRRSVASSLESGERVNVFVNLHPHDLLDEALYASDSALAPFASRIVLEITERESLSDIAELRARIGELKGLGYRIAIDDLGAGYAGMSSFAALEPDFVKLDMSLVRRVEANATAQKVVASLVSLSHSLGATVIAEGIETSGERDALLGLGCDLLQGYLFGRPGPYMAPATF